MFSDETTLVSLPNTYNEAHLLVVTRALECLYALSAHSEAVCARSLSSSTTRWPTSSSSASKNRVPAQAAAAATTIVRQISTVWVIALVFLFSHILDSNRNCHPHIRTFTVQMGQTYLKPTDQRQDDIVPNYSVVSNPNYSSMNHEQVINSNCTHAPAPNIIYPAMSYEQRMQLLSTMRQQRREFIAKRLKENLPAQPITVASLFVIALSIALFTLQIVMLTANDRRANAGSGWWGGVVGCIFGIIHLVLGWFEFSLR